MNPSLQFSRTMAIGLGLATPFVETIRRWREVVDMTVWWPAFIDDYLMGAFLLYGALRVGREGDTARGVLAAAWAFFCGMAYSSFFHQLQLLSQPDPSGLPPGVVVAVKGIGLAIGVLGLVGALRTSKVRGA